MVRAENLTATLVYTYNADGLRIAQSQSVASVESVDTFTWDWATPVPELLSDGDSLYLIGYDTLGWQRGDDWTFVLPDALGSVRQETDATGAVTAVREWSPYGEALGGAQTGLGFTGEWFDANVGLTYLRARWYLPRDSIFVSRDPVEDEPPYQPLVLVLEAEGCQMKMDSTILIHLQAVPLYQDIEHCHCVSQAAFEVVPLAMHHFLEMIDQGQH